MPSYHESLPFLMAQKNCEGRTQAGEEFVYCENDGTKYGSPKIKEWIRKKVIANAVFQSLQNALLVRVDTEREWNLVQRLDEFSVDGHTQNLQQVPRRMTTDEVFKFVGEEVRKEYKAHPKFSIKTEVLGGGGVQWLRLRLRQTPPPCTVQLMLFC